MRALITGAEGFAGGHLIRHLLQTDPALELHGTARPDGPYAHVKNMLASVTPVDLRDEEAVLGLIDALRPDYIFHLAAQASVKRSFEEPWETLENNLHSQLSILQAAVKLDIKPRVLVVASAEIYGIVPAEDMPLTEDFPLRPTSPYSVSKVGQDLMGLQYFLSYQIPVLRVRSFNHIGPGQNPNWVVPNFATQVVRIEAGLQEPVIKVGNLSAQRDFTDVRDVVAAYHAVVTVGKPGEAYNVCSGQARSIQDVLDMLLSMSTVSVDVQVDPDRLRPVDQPLVVGSSERLQRDTGWRPALTFEQTLRDVLEECRERVQQELRR